MSSPYSQSHLHSSSSQLHSQVERNTTVPTSDPQPIPPHFTTPMPTFVAQPSPTRPPMPPSSSTTTSLVQSSRLPLRKRPAKDQKPVHPPPLQWQPIETAETTIEPYSQRPEFVAPSFETHTAAIHGGSSYTESLVGRGYDSIEFSYHQHDQPHNDKYHTNSFSSNSPSPLEPTTPSLLSSIIPPKPIVHKQKQQQEQQQPSLKKKHNTGTDENDRPIKKTKRGRPPLSSSAAKPLSSHTTTNKTNLGTSDPNTSSKDISSNDSKSLSKSQPTPSSNTKHTSMLYCLCRKPYDESQFMIACDRCEEWFHGECIDIDEKQGEFVDSYYCADCAKASGKQTSWKPKCSNPTCQKPARTGKNQHAHLSKYCSGACGMQVARERLASSDQQQRQLTTTNNDDNDNDGDNNGHNDMMSFTTRMERLSNSRLSLYADRDDRLRLIRIRGEKRRAIDTINSMNLKQQFLQALVRAVEQDQSTNDYCGFDSRLLWDDEQWSGVTGIATEPTLRLIKSHTEAETQDDAAHDSTVCHQKSKRCQRHNGWIKLKTTELEQERDEQFVVLSILARERKLIKTRMNNRLDEMNVARSLMNGTLLH